MHLLKNCSLKTIKKRGKRGTRKFWWDECLDDVKQESLRHFNNWKNAGRPAQGILHESKINAHKNYKNAVNFNKKKYNSKVSEDLQRNLVSATSAKFWKCWKGYFKGNKNTLNNVTIDGFKKEIDVANVLANNLKNACTPNSDRKHQNFKDLYFDNKTANRDLNDKCYVDVETLDGAINHISANKAPGFDGLSIEHIKYAHPSVIIILRTLFNIMIHTGIVPDEFGIGITTPIPKFKGCKRSVSADDFRGITICPIISKIFEYCIIKHVNFKTSNRQFGFKKKVGCINSLHTVRKVINYFNVRKSTVNIGVIDLKKAFDKCNSFGILCMLQKRNVNSGIINILENWFAKNSTTVKWNNVTSSRVPLLSGVKQGGVLSPILFTLFVDCVLELLEESNLGCFINYTCYNSFMYADDIMLMSLSVSDLQLMLNMCNNVFNDLDLPINVAKCHCLRIGPRYKSPCASLKMQGVDLNWVESIKYLGVTICKAKTFKCQWDEAKGKFFRASNAILGKIGTRAAEDVILKLISSHAVSVLLYGTVATTLQNSDLKIFDNAYDSIFGKVFHCNDKIVIKQCQYYSGYWPLHLLHDYNRYNFFNKLIMSNSLNKGLELDFLDCIDFESLQKNMVFMRWTR